MGPSICMKPIGEKIWVRNWSKDRATCASPGEVVQDWHLLNRCSKWPIITHVCYLDVTLNNCLQSSIGCLTLINSSHFELNMRAQRMTINQAIRINPWSVRGPIWLTIWPTSFWKVVQVFNKKSVQINSEGVSLAQKQGQIRTKEGQLPLVDYLFVKIYRIWKFQSIKLAYYVEFREILRITIPTTPCNVYI